MPASQFKEKIFAIFRSGTQTNKQTHTQNNRIVKLIFTSRLKFLHSKTVFISRAM